MTRLTKVLRKLKKEGLRVKSEIDIESTVEFLGETNVTEGRENWNINYTKKGEFKLETSWSNQLVTDEWLRKTTRLYKIIKS